MNYILSLNNITEENRLLVGGKGYALARLLNGGYQVPDGVCITTDCYSRFLAETGLGERILLELNRKHFAEMRWEEIWDASLRIRNFFLTKSLPDSLFNLLHDGLQKRFDNNPVVVRSSSPDEDTATSSFAGLHESYINVQSAESVIDHIVKVWASLWSDGALLYRKELGLRVDISSMAVVVQEMVVGECSGVAFSRSPDNHGQAVIESVFGLNQGQVDGTIEPDRWVIDRDTGKVSSHFPAPRKNRIVADMTGTKMEKLDQGAADTPPLSVDGVQKVFRLAMGLEGFWGVPQDVEWTKKNEEIHILQTRPITTGGEANQEDNRGWYLSLHRSFDNLKMLRDTIENKLIPAMIREAEKLAALDVSGLSDEALSREILRRHGVYDSWVKKYWADFIPFAHGVRLFGQFYNDVMCPEDPFGFMDLLQATDMVSLQRNRMLEDLAERIREKPDIKKSLQSHSYGDLASDFKLQLNSFIDQFGMLYPSSGDSEMLEKSYQPVVHFLVELAGRSPSEQPAIKEKNSDLVASFLNMFQGEKRVEAEEILDLARASYRLRDDDNIHLGRIESQYVLACAEGKRRLQAQGRAGFEKAESGEIARALKDQTFQPEKQEISEEEHKIFHAKARQLVGQPAGPGLAQGKARVIVSPEELREFKNGEILICDAIDPNMTFIIPLAAAIVERRGGMLIHGAIIAREYGLPCVTGIPNATSAIETGDMVTVDGYLGIVTIG